MRRLAWVTLSPPNNRYGGGHIRQAHLLIAASEDFEIHLVTIGPLRDEKVRAACHEVVEVDPHARAPLPRWQRRIRDVARAVFSRHPSEVVDARRARAALSKAGRAVISCSDLVCLDYAGLAPLLPRNRAQPWILTLHNMLSGMDEQAKVLASGRRQALLLARDAAIARRFESWVVRSFDRVVVVSEEDAEKMPGPVDLIRTGVDAASLISSPLRPEPNIVFTGALYTLPNNDGALWFCNLVLPLIQRQIPEVKLSIVGRSPTAEVRALGLLRGVTVHADVPDVQPYVRAARTAVVPLRIGTGIRVKALEAMAAGRPVAGTAIGLEGIAYRAGEDALIGDSPDALARAVVRLLQDDNEAARIARNARRLIEEQYDWPAIKRQWRDLLVETVRRPLSAPDRPGLPPQLPMRD